jgi:hypothetical protein
MPDARALAGITIYFGFLFCTVCSGQGAGHSSFCCLEWEKPMECTAFPFRVFVLALLPFNFFDLKQNSDLPINESGFDAISHVMIILSGNDYEIDTLKYPHLQKKRSVIATARNEREAIC